jgi:hypothetical protein
LALHKICGKNTSLKITNSNPHLDNHQKDEKDDDDLYFSLFNLIALNKYSRIYLSKIKLKKYQLINYHINLLILTY